MHFVEASTGKVTHIATIRVTKGLPNVLMTFCELNANGWKHNRGNRPICKFCLGDLKRLLKRLNLRVEEETKHPIPDMPNNDQPLTVHLPQELIQRAKEHEIHSVGEIKFIIKNALQDWIEHRHRTVLYLHKLPPWTDRQAAHEVHPLDFADTALSYGWVKFTDFNYSNPVVILAACVPDITPNTDIERQALQDGYVKKDGEWVKDTSDAPPERQQT